MGERESERESERERERERGTKKGAVQKLARVQWKKCVNELLVYSAKEEGRKINASLTLEKEREGELLLLQCRGLKNVRCSEVKVISELERMKGAEAFKAKGYC